MEIKLTNKYFVLRHGQSNANVLGIILSSLEDGKREEYTLSIQGEGQVKVSVKKAKESELLGSDTIIYSSPFSRTKRTAEIAKEVLGVEDDINFDDRLRERWFGDWEKMSHSAYKKVWLADKKNPGHKRYNVESETEVLERMMSLIKDLEKKHKNKNILLVSHGDPIMILHSAIAKISLILFRKNNNIQTGEIREIK